jgi:hypothetical protein
LALTGNDYSRLIVSTGDGWVVIAVLDLWIAASSFQGGLNQVYNLLCFNRANHDDDHLCWPEIVVVKFNNVIPLDTAGWFLHTRLSSSIEVSRKRSLSNSNAAISPVYLCAYGKSGEDLRL